MVWEETFRHGTICKFSVSKMKIDRPFVKGYYVYPSHGALVELSTRIRIHQMLRLGLQPIRARVRARCSIRVRVRIGFTLTIRVRVKLL